jgi:hypothetical protein
MLHQAHPLSGQVPQPALAVGVDVSRRQNAEAHQVREPERIVLIVDVLQQRCSPAAPRSLPPSTHRPTNTS